MHLSVPVKGVSIGRLRREGWFILREGTGSNGPIRIEFWRQQEGTLSQETSYLTCVSLALTPAFSYRCRQAAWQ